MDIISYRGVFFTFCIKKVHLNNLKNNNELKSKFHVERNTMKKLTVNSQETNANSKKNSRSAHEEELLHLMAYNNRTSRNFC